MDAPLWSVVLLLRNPPSGKSHSNREEYYKELHLLREELLAELRANRQENGQNITRSINGLGQALLSGQNRAAQESALRQDSLRQSVAELTRNLETRFQGFARQTQDILAQIRQDNAQQLTQMRATVDEKLEKSLEARLNQSFQLVSQRLEQVYKGLGEMQTLAAGSGGSQTGSFKCEGARDFGRNSIRRDSRTDPIPRAI